MNRYIIQGIFQDLADGKTIALHARPSDARQVFDEIISSFPKSVIEHISRVNGQEKISLHNGGQLRLIQPTYGSLRGHVPNVLITDELLDINDETAMIDHGTEIIHYGEAHLVINDTHYQIYNQPNGKCEVWAWEECLGEYERDQTINIIINHAKDQK